MAHGVLRLRLHLGKGKIMTVGDENRIITEALVTPRRPDGDPLDRAFKTFDMTIRPGEGQRADKARPARLWRHGAFLLQLLLNLLHSKGKVLAGTCPAGREDTGRPAQSFNRKPRIIAERHHLRTPRRRQRLDFRVGDKAVAILYRLEQAEARGRDRLDIEPRE